MPDHGVQQCFDSVRASFNLVKVFFCFSFLELVFVLVSAKRKDNDDVLMLVFTRAKSVTSLHPVRDEVQMRKPLLVSAQPWSPPLRLYQ